MSHLVIICPLVMPVADPPGKRLQLRCVAALADFSASRSSSSASLSSPSGVWMEIPAAARVVRKRFTMDMRAIFFGLNGVKSVLSFCSSFMSWTYVGSNST